MKKIVLLTIPSSWLTVENASDRIDILEEAIKDNLDSKIIIVSSILDNGYSVARKINICGKHKIETIPLVYEQIDRYFLLCRRRNLGVRNQRLFDCVENVRNVISKNSKLNWIIAGALSARFADASQVLLEDFVGSLGKNLVRWPSDTVYNKGNRLKMTLCNKTTESNVCKFLNSGDLPDISIVSPSYGTSLSGVELLLGSDSVDSFSDFLLFILKNKSKELGIKKVSRVSMAFYKSKLVVEENKVAIGA